MSKLVVRKVTGRLEKFSVTVLLMNGLTCLDWHVDKMQTNLSRGEGCIDT